MQMHACEVESFIGMKKSAPLGNFNEFNDFSYGLHMGHYVDHSYVLLLSYLDG